MTSRRTSSWHDSEALRKFIDLKEYSTLQILAENAISLSGRLFCLPGLSTTENIFCRGDTGKELELVMSQRSVPSPYGTFLLERKLCHLSRLAGLGDYKQTPRQSCKCQSFTFSDDYMVWYTLGYNYLGGVIYVLHVTLARSRN